MLITLHIENIAVIERADIEFAAGFNVLTGETGAGKSIIIDSLGAILGGRTSRSLVRAGADKALVSAVFSAPQLEAWCEENGLELEDGELVIQRRIGADGKSGCRVNGRPVSVSQLRELGAQLLDIHGQNDGRELLDEESHLSYLDSFGLDSALFAEYSGKYQALRQTAREIKRLSSDNTDKELLAERLRMQIDELESAKLRSGEQDELEARRELLKNAGRLTESIDGAYSALYADDSSAITLSGEAEALLERAAGWSGEVAGAGAVVREARLLLEDAAERLRDLRDSLDFSPEEFDAIETRLAIIRRLTKKYALDEEGLIASIPECRERLDELEYSDERLEKLNSLLQQQHTVALESAERLTAARAAAGERLSERIETQLRELNMPSVRFRVQILPKKLDATGADEVCFLMSANAGEEPGKISKIASGGELSRIMLAMKSVFSEGDRVPSMVFDEIDTGVSGIAAQRVGEKMAGLAGSKQVLCVTHLPQIAALADAHYIIQKAEKNGRTYTSVQELDDEGRALELSRLHGGDVVTEKTLISAREQLLAARKFKESLI